MNNINRFYEFVNEGISNKELLDELKDAKYIGVTYNGEEGGWGVEYHKNQKKFTAGRFNSNHDVHNFLIENDIDYNERTGFEYMRKYRKPKDNVPFQAYQQDLIDNGIENMYEKETE